MAFDFQGIVFLFSWGVGPGQSVFFWKKPIGFILNLKNIGRVAYRNARALLIWFCFAEIDKNPVVAVEIPLEIVHAGPWFHQYALESLTLGKLRSAWYLTNLVLNRSAFFKANTSLSVPIGPSNGGVMNPSVDEHDLRSTVERGWKGLKDWHFRRQRFNFSKKNRAILLKHLVWFDTSCCIH